MRTARALTVSPSKLSTGGVYLVPRGVPGPAGCTWSRGGVYLVPGVCVPGPRGVPGPGGVPGHGSAPGPGGVVYLVQGGVPGPGGCTCSGTPPSVRGPQVAC